MTKYYTPPIPAINFANTGSALSALGVQQAEPIIQYPMEYATKQAHFGGVIRFNRDSFKKYLFSNLFPPYPFFCVPAIANPTIGTLVELTGSNFVSGVGVSGSQVYVDTSLVSSTFIDSTHISFISPVIAGETEHETVITVRNPEQTNNGVVLLDQLGHTIPITGSNPSIFSFEFNPFLVSISSSLQGGFYPATSSFIQGEVPLELEGFYFKKGSIIRVVLSGSASISTQVVWESSNSLSALSPNVAVTGVYNLYVQSPSGLQSDALPITYIYHFPVINALIPPQAATDGGDPIVITGSYFLSGAAVTVDGLTASFYTYMSTTEMSFITPTHATGTVPITVVNPDGQVSPSATLRYIFGIPRMIMITPTIGSTGSVFEVMGKYFSGSSVVSSMWLSPVGMTSTMYNIPEYTIVNNLSASFVMPLVPVGSYLLFISSSAGVGVNSTESLTYVTSPVITLVSPASGGVAGGFTLDIFGANFLNTSVWTIAATTQSVNYLTSGHVQMVAPQHVTGTVPITVTNFGLFSGSSTFTYIELPSILSGNAWTPTVG